MKIFVKMEKKRMESDLLKNIKMPMQLQELLPCGYSYKVKKWTPFENKPNHFEAVILTNVYTEEEAQEWWHEFNVKSNTTMRVRATCPKTGKVNIFKIYLRCLHQGRADKVEKSELQQKTKTAATSIKRNTNCPAGMIVAIRRHIKYSRSKMRDPVDPVHPCEIQIRFIHNHPTNCADSLRFRPVSKEVEEKLINLYQIGHSPASALEMLKIDLQIKHASAYSQIISDRYHCPDKSFCYRLYYKHFGKDYAASSKKDVINLLNVKVLDYNTEMGESCFCIGISGTDYVIALCSPLMKRAHALLQSHTMVYIDTCESPSNKERSEHYILFMVAHTAAGGVPLGAILCTSNNDSILNLGFQLLKQLLPEHAFFGRGEAGPYAFMIEDSESLQTALRNVWPDSDVVICIFRILQSMWQWLWNEKHNIMKDHRLYLLYLTKTVLFASSETEIDEKYQALSVDNISIIYPAYLQQLNCLWEKKHMWGICFHRLLPLLGANNYYEAAVRALKDKVFEQTKSFNTIQLLNFMATHLDSYYKAKLLDILHNKVIHIFRSCYSNVIPSHIDREIKQVAGNYFLIPSDLTDEKIHTVDMELNTCSCSVGISGAFCIHQYWIFLKVPSEMFKVGIIDMELRQKLFVIATGNSTFEEISHSVAVAHSTLSQVMPNDASNINTENTSLSNVECIFPENNSSHSRDNHSCISASNVIISLDSNHELITLSSVDTQVSSKPFIKTTACIGQVTENLAAHSYVETDKSISNVDSEDVSTVCLENTSEVSEEKSEQDNSDMTKRMTKVMEKFEDFCQQVRDGLKNQPKDFVPALEIMMKTLERKAPSLINKGRKRSIASTAIGTEVMVPKVHGRQMITYGKKRPMIDNPDETLALKTSETIRNGTSNDEICELSKSK